MFRGNAKIAQLVGARLRTSLDAIGAEPFDDLDTLLRKLDARARRQPSRYVSLSERLQQMKNVEQD